MSNLVNPEVSPVVDDSEAKIRVLLEKAMPVLEQELAELPEGFQYDINAPHITIQSREEYAGIMGRPIDSLGGALIGTGKLKASPLVGVLNVSKEKDGSGPDIEYRSKTGGESFMVGLHGDKTVVESALPIDKVLGGLSLLFDQEGRLNKSEEGIHVATRRSLEFFDRDGEPKPRIAPARIQQIPSKV